MIYPYNNNDFTNIFKNSFIKMKAFLAEKEIIFERFRIINLTRIPTNLRIFGISNYL